MVICVCCVVVLDISVFIPFTIRLAVVVTGPVLHLYLSRYMAFGVRKDGGPKDRRRRIF